jgi:ABC-type glycerol-3-phosphate transport system permease component
LINITIVIITKTITIITAINTLIITIILITSSLSPSPQGLRDLEPPGPGRQFALFVLACVPAVVMVVMSQHDLRGIGSVLPQP